MEPLAEVEARFVRLLLGELHGMMKLAANRGSGSVTIPVSDVQTKILERWAGYSFTLDRGSTQAKKVYHPRSDLKFEKVRIFTFVVCSCNIIVP
jgi:hypothetical protein